MWVATMRRLADPVLRNLAAGTLKARMPVEQAAGADRRSVTHLEAMGRLMAGIAPWIELRPDATAEGRCDRRYADLARRAIARAVDPASPDSLNFTRERQPLVDAAFLAQGLLRAQTALRDALEAATKKQLVAALESTRVIAPPSTTGCCLPRRWKRRSRRSARRWDRMRVDYALRQHEQWYKGDGPYGDGPSFHWDYYNSFVIQPMLLDVLAVCATRCRHGRSSTRAFASARARYAAIQERLISPEGRSRQSGGRSRTGSARSTCWRRRRCGARCPTGSSPAQVRGALTSVIKRALEAPGTFDAEGWLRIGFCGHQPGIGESYISTGSLYLCAVGLLPLGLPRGCRSGAAAAAVDLERAWAARRSRSITRWRRDPSLSSTNRRSRDQEVKRSG